MRNFLYLLLITQIIQANELDNVNTKYFELNPIISADGSKIWFSVEGHPENTNYSEDPYSLDIWYCDMQENGTWSKPIHLDGELNNKGYNRVVSVAPSGKILVLAGKYKDGEWSEDGISISKFDEGWGEPRAIEIEDFSNKSRFIDYYLSNNGDKLLISAKMDESEGDRDIYYCEKNNRKWSKPKSLGREINSKFEDSSPYLAPDNKTLYFTSNRSGNHDIWYSKRLENWTNWSEPKKLDNKINTGNWESYFTVDANNNAYLIREVNVSNGNTDIIKIDLNEESKPDITYILKGKVKNSKTNEYISAEIIYEDMVSGEKLGETVSEEETGDYVITLSNNNNVLISAKKENYYSISEKIVFESKKREINRDIELKRIEVGESVRLNNIFFETGESDLLEESFVELSKVIDLLKENSTIKIEIQGHTDDIGNKDDNLKLSDNRAKAVKEYLVSQGIDEQRINYKGFGESIPITKEKSMEARSQNRRVEFKIIEK